MPGKSRKKISEIKKREMIAAYVFLLPSLVGFSIFIIGPVIAGLSVSFLQWDILTPAKFVGLQNYIDLVHDKTFFIAFGNTLYFSVGTVAGSLVVSLILAMLVSKVPNRVLFVILRTIFVLPMMITMIATAIIWGWMLDTNFGVINYLLSLLGFSPIRWFGSLKWAMPAMIMLSIWPSIGFGFLVFLAGLAGIPIEYYEAARVDGANSFQEFFHITLPILSSSIFFVLMISFIWAFQGFAQFYALTRGGPGSATKTIVYYLYQVGFNYLRLGSGTAIAVIFFIVIMFLTLLQWKLGKRWVFYK